MNKIVSTKRTSATFLAIVLVAGTIALLSSPSFMTKGEAQAQPYYGMDNDYKSQKDSSKSVFINKLKCINTNININGENTGNINIGNKGQVGTAEEGYYDGYSNKDKGFDCTINNNNTNTNLVGNGNQTEPLTCEECFIENLNEEQLNNVTIALSVSRVGNLEGLCEALSNTTFTNQEKLVALSALFTNAGITDVDAILRVLECLEELRLIIVPPNFDPILR